ncbi:hypothetical protein WJ50_12860 [Burkholderia ubonensis]|nr:hypothetical protein WJ49_22730 [Burkholderia ubonensis]KVL73194.1 hypothetical protein WJ48_00425 [Burkholderia ubonensis]KVL91021.1 hypothetical protein WJ50_12860 [Burkholderia ubonensis]
MMMRIRKALVVACSLILTAAANAADLIAMTMLTPDNTVNGTVVQLREAGRDGCSYIGAFHDADREHAIVWGHIELMRKRCGDLVSPASGLIALRRTHTFLDVNGQIQPGYRAGDVVANIR